MILQALPTSSVPPVEFCSLKYYRVVLALGCLHHGIIVRYGLIDNPSADFNSLMGIYLKLFVRELIINLFERLVILIECLRIKMWFSKTCLI